jgi:hypothetical protein
MNEARACCLTIPIIGIIFAEFLFLEYVRLCYATLPAFQMQTLRPSRSILWQRTNQRQAQADDPTAF